MSGSEKENDSGKIETRVSEKSVEKDPNSDDKVRMKKIKEYFHSREILSRENFSIVVDGFRFTRQHHQQLTEKGYQPKVMYLLSHFHSDHYTGLTPSWGAGTILCSPETVALCCSELGMRREVFFPVELLHVYYFSEADGSFIASSRREEKENLADHLLPPQQFSILPLPANHCPGAVMFVLQSASFGTVLHTGDFRYHNVARNEFARALETGEKFYQKQSLVGTPLRPPFFEQFVKDAIQPFRDTVDLLYLDNTFCDQRFSFPYQWEVNTKVIQTLIEMFHQQEVGAEGTVHIAVLIGSYTIGKERVAFSLQEAFEPDRTQNDIPFVPIQVSEQKYNIMQSMDFHPERFQKIAPSNGTYVTLPSLVPADDPHSVRRQLFNENEAAERGEPTTRYQLSIFIVPMAEVTYPSLVRNVGVRKGILAESETPKVEESRNFLCDLQQNRFSAVLAIEPTGWRKKIYTSHVTRTVTLLSVPYSEHCSFPEMVSFVEAINPKNIIPTVSKETYSQCESYFVEKAPRLNTKFGNTQPLNRFFVVKKMKTEPQRLSEEIPPVASTLLPLDGHPQRELPLIKEQTKDSPIDSKRTIKKATLTSFFKSFHPNREAHTVAESSACILTTHKSESAFIVEDDDADAEVIVISDDEDERVSQRT